MAFLQYGTALNMKDKTAAASLAFVIIMVKVCVALAFSSASSLVL